MNSDEKHSEESKPSSHSLEASAATSAVTVPAEGQLVVVAPKTSTFVEFQRREGLMVHATAGAVLGTTLASAVISTAVLGPIWGLGLLAIGFSGLGWMANHWGMYGNDGLEARLRTHLGLEGSQWQFVGFCRSDQNRISTKLFPPRVETDENVGFVKTTETHLSVRMEGLSFEIERARVRDVRLEPVAEAPSLEWVRVEIYQEDDSLDGLLLMRRAGRTLTEQRDRNRDWFETLRAWHVDPTIRGLVVRGELPESVLEPT